MKLLSKPLLLLLQSNLSFNHNCQSEILSGKNSFFQTSLCVRKKIIYILYALLPEEYAKGDKERMRRENKYA